MKKRSISGFGQTCFFGLIFAFIFIGFLVFDVQAEPSSKDVTITNLPLPTAITNTPVRQPWTFDASVRTSDNDPEPAPGGQSKSSDVFYIPNDKILVVEQVTSHCTLNQYDDFGGLWIHKSLNGESLSVPLDLPMIRERWGIHFSNELMRLYCEGSISVVMYIYEGSGNGYGNNVCTIVMSGYLLPKDSPTLSP